MWILKREKIDKFVTSGFALGGAVVTSTPFTHSRWEESKLHIASWDNELCRMHSSVSHMYVKDETEPLYDKIVDVPASTVSNQASPSKAKVTV
jgi:hypothetical protein